MVTIVGSVEDWGFIPEMLNEADPRPAREQLDARNGWLPLHNPDMRFDPERRLFTYPGDPPLRAISSLRFRNELLFLFPASVILIWQPDGTWEVARMD